jgi:quercetin dioxygenase-like cupin family protein
MASPRTWSLVAVLASGIAGCATRPPPALLWADLAGVRCLDVGEILRALETVAPGIRTGSWGESPEATFQLLEIAAAEPPHVHDHHDLTIVLLAGSGTLVLAGRAYLMTAGDVAHIDRGVMHHFHPSNGQPCVGLAVFTPRLTGADRRLVPG